MKIKILFYLFIFFIWEMISRFYLEIILPSPLEVLNSIKTIFSNINFISIISFTFGKTIISIFISIIIGLLIGVAMGINKQIKELIYPIVIFWQGTPVISWIMLALIWFDTSIIPIIILILSTVPNMSLGIYQGISSTDKRLLEMSYLFNVNKKKQILNLYIPSVIPYFLGGLRILISTSIKICVMAEVISKAESGIGEQINWAWINIETSEIFSWTIIIIVLSFLFEKFTIKFLELKLRRYL